ncbi:hypothetical protein ABZ484_07160 [Streptomyces sp. NPDC006393]|uniref:hypothetical protein n=1 Tax=Streptomyces sp. NPDC006393 TaxID=3156763 RepID=UPI0033D50DCF
MKTIAKAAVGALLAAGAVMAPLSMEAAAAPLPTVKAVAPAVHLGMHAHASNHRAYTYHRSGELRRHCYNNRNDYWRHGYRDNCRYYSWDWDRYGNRHHHRDCDLYWRR